MYFGYFMPVTGAKFLGSCNAVISNLPVYVCMFLLRSYIHLFLQSHNFVTCLRLQRLLLWEVPRVKFLHVCPGCMISHFKTHHKRTLWCHFERKGTQLVDNIVVMRKSSIMSHFLICTHTNNMHIHIRPYLCQQIPRLKANLLLSLRFIFAWMRW